MVKCDMYLIVSNSTLNSIPDYEWVKEENILVRM